MELKKSKNEVLKTYKLIIGNNANDLIYLLQKNHEKKKSNPDKNLKSVKFDPESHKFLFQSKLKRHLRI